MFDNVEEQEIMSRFFFFFFHDSHAKLKPKITLTKENAESRVGGWLQTHDLFIQRLHAQLSRSFPWACTGAPVTPPQAETGVAGSELPRHQTNSLHRICKR